MNLNNLSRVVKRNIGVASIFTAGDGGRGCSVHSTVASNGDDIFSHCPQFQYVTH